jgi:hypothetical protein
MNASRIFLVAAGFLVAFGVSASGKLTTDTIDRWLDAMPAVESWAEKNGIDEQEIAAGEDGIPDFVGAIKELESGRDGLEDIASEHGFDGAIDWADTSNRITRAFLALEMSQQDTDMAAVERQMEQRMAQIENNDQMSDAQKQQMRQQMDALQQSLRVAKKMTEDVPEADQRAVAERRDALKEFYEGQQ